MAVLFSNRKRAVLGTLATVLASAVLGVGLPAACISAPPADPPQVQLPGPTIVPEFAQPPTDGWLTELPPDGSFVVPVRVTDPLQTIYGGVTVNYDPGMTNNKAGSQGSISFFPSGLSWPPALDGGVTLVSFQLTPANFPDPSACAIIELSVSYGMFSESARTPGTAAAVSSIDWHYSPNGPGVCEEFDAGDGAFPPDAPLDGLPLTPDALGPL